MVAIVKCIKYYLIVKRINFRMVAVTLDEICNALCSPSFPSLSALSAVTEHFLLVFVSVTAKKPKAALFLVSVFL